MAEHAPQTMVQCIHERHDAHAYKPELHDRAADIFANAIWVTSPEEASEEIIKAAGQEYIDTQYIYELATRAGASKNSINQALAIIKRKDRQTYENMFELLSEKGLLE